VSSETLAVLFTLSQSVAALWLSSGWRSDGSREPIDRRPSGACLLCVPHPSVCSSST